MLQVQPAEAPSLYEMEAEPKVKGQTVAFGAVGCGEKGFDKWQKGIEVRGLLGEWINQTGVQTHSWMLKVLG